MSQDYARVTWQWAGQAHDATLDGKGAWSSTRGADFNFELNERFSFRAIPLSPSQGEPAMLHLTEAAAWLRTLLGVEDVKAEYLREIRDDPPGTIY